MMGFPKVRQSIKCCTEKNELPLESGSSQDCFLMLSQWGSDFLSVITFAVDPDLNLDFCEAVF